MMTVSTDPAAEVSHRRKVPQDSLWVILFMFLWPAVWYTLLIYVFVARLVPEGEKVSTGLFQLVIVLGPGAEMLAGLLLLRREGYRRGDGMWRERIRWRWPSGRRAWLLTLLVFVLAFAGSMLLGPLNVALANTPGFIPPDWWPALSDPRAEVTGVADAFPDVQFEGNFLFLLQFLILGLVFNVFGEEIYYRGYLLPRMRGVFGRWDWVANGVLFTLKHFYQRWLYPGILIGGLAFAFAAGPLGSLPMAMIFHWLGNFLFSSILLIAAVLGLG